MFTYLVTLKIIRLAQARGTQMESRTVSDEVLAQVARLPVVLGEQRGAEIDRDPAGTCPRGHPDGRPGTDDRDEMGIAVLLQDKGFARNLP